MGLESPHHITVFKIEAEPMMANEVMEVVSNPLWRDDFPKGVSTSTGRTTLLFPSGDQPSIERQRILREAYKRPEAEALETLSLSTRRKRDNSYSTSPDVPESSMEDNDEDPNFRDMTSAVKRFKTPHNSGSDYLENIRSGFHISNRKSQIQRSHKFVGVGRTLGGPPSQQRKMSPDPVTSASTGSFPLRVESAIPLHGKGNLLANGQAPKILDGHFKEHQPLCSMQANNGAAVDKNDTRKFVPGAIPLPAELEPEQVSEKEEEEEEEFLVPKLEPGLVDEDVVGSLLKLGGFEKESEDGFMVPQVVKRTRGRPRKYPLPVSGETSNSLGKGRSKTGCITCRKRKKKCDEAKPGCLNCQKNAVLCEGYQPLMTWRSGKEKACCEGRPDHDFLPSSAFSASSRIQALGIILPPIIHGVDTPTDKLFFAHYIHRLSDKLSLQGRGLNAFRDEMIPTAVHHVGLMHSILSLSAASIHWDTPYGENLLRRVPGVTVRELEDRGHYHQDAALEESRHDISLELAARQKGAQPDPLIMKVRFGQLVCFVVKAMAEGNTEGAHRLHIKAYETYCIDTRDAPPEKSSFMDFIREFFQYYMVSDQLLIGPPQAHPALSEDEFWMSPETEMTPPSFPCYDDPHGSLFGLQHGIYMSLLHRIGSLRNEIRLRMELNEEPHVNYQSLHKVAQIDTDIRNWKDPPEPPRSHAEESTLDKRHREQAEKVYSTGMLYKQMLWVYLFRTVYTPSSTAPPGFLQLRASDEFQGNKEENFNHLANDPRIKQVVDHGIQLLEAFKKDDPCQTVLLSPAFIIGCSCFVEHQRDAIRKVVEKIRNYTTLRNTDPALRVLEEVWRRMDGKGETGKQGGIEFVLRNRKGERDGGRESSWDWEQIAREMEVDFLAA